MFYYLQEFASIQTPTFCTIALGIVELVMWQSQFGGTNQNTLGCLRLK